MLIVPDWILGGWGHPWHHGSLLYVILDLCTKFQFSSMNRSVLRAPRPQSHTWRRLMFPDWILGGWSHPWCHGSSWYVILDLCAKFKLSSMNRSVPRTPCPWSPYLEDIDGSLLDTWRMGSSLKSWIIILCDSCLVWTIWALKIEVCQEPAILKVISRGKVLYPFGLVWEANWEANWSFPLLFTVW